MCVHVVQEFNYSELDSILYRCSAIGQRGNPTKLSDRNILLLYTPGGRFDVRVPRVRTTMQMMIRSNLNEFVNFKYCNFKCNIIYFKSPETTFQIDTSHKNKLLPTTRAFLRNLLVLF